MVTVYIQATILYILKYFGFFDRQLLIDNTFLIDSCIIYSEMFWILKVGEGMGKRAKWLAGGGGGR